MPKGQRGSLYYEREKNQSSSREGYCCLHRPKEIKSTLVQQAWTETQQSGKVLGELPHDINLSQHRGRPPASCQLPLLIRDTSTLRMRLRGAFPLHITYGVAYYWSGLPEERINYEQTDTAKKLHR